MPGQLVLLPKTGAGLRTFLPQVGRVASTIYQAVEANAARISAEATGRWADMLRTTMPEGLVRDAILASPAWPDTATQMAALDQQGVDVACPPRTAPASTEPWLPFPRGRAARSRLSRSWS
ncbi:hypothetical protein [Streptomyces bambusae]|uniref:Uncharacterized protein n=1 Tax=Streptomyces bambusae TaxID=1550616 RepID=A0ABS6Z7W3_9ACTN|nr:hypothetical protein [Streptomyces bambusae]MBW5482796.1 hypothetical protein [Streptomyces bambusae]